MLQGPLSTICVMHDAYNRFIYSSEVWVRRRAPTGGRALGSAAIASELASRLSLQLNFDTKEVRKPALFAPYTVDFLWLGLMPD